MNHFHHQIDGFLDQSACAVLVHRAEQVGFQAASVTFASGPAMATHIRNNDRVTLDDPALAEALWLRLCVAVPHLPDLQHAIGLNPRFRFYRYDTAQRFKPHRDGTVRLPDGIASRLTVLFYLNDDFVGGETVLMPEGPRPEQAGSRIAIRPTLGGVLLFSHSTWHEGQAVTEGRKYVLRSDVLYQESEA
jgi:predicted 2-oxoglutarate/Fe(II)-dependent dioxygenase YbiX